MINQLIFDQDEDIMMLNPDPETAAMDDDEDEFDDGGAEFDDVGSGAGSGYGEDDINDIEDDMDGDDIDENFDEDDLDEDNLDEDDDLD